MDADALLVDETKEDFQGMRGGYSSDVCSVAMRKRQRERDLAFPRAAHIGSNEPPPGYPSAGCISAEPASVSPGLVVPLA